MKDWALKKNWHYIVLAAITVLAAAVRLYHFSDWLFFAMDQARDGFIAADAAQNGIAHLPLLGPRAAGTFLRLGPIFYYFQFFTAKLTGSTDPTVFALPDLIFSILSIPLLFFFLRLYFSRVASLASTAIYAASFVAIQYSRFAWNPNSVPFWTLLCLYGLLRFSGAEGKERYKWIAVAAVGFSIATQMHFIVFAALPVIVLFYLFLSKGFARAGWRGFGLAAAIVLFFYLPMILSDMQTGGDNIRQFFFALHSKPQGQSLRASFIQNIYSHGKYYFFFLSSYVSRSYFPSVIAGIVLIAGGVLAAGKNYFSEKDAGRKNFLALVLVWAAISFLILTPFSLTSQPRFFFLAMALPFVFFAFWAEQFLSVKKWFRYSAVLVVAAAAFLVGLNLEATAAWYGGLKNNSAPVAVRGRVLEIKQSENLQFTLTDVRAVSDYLRQEGQTRGQKIFISGNMSYRVPIQYLLETADPPADYKIIGRSDMDRDVSYFSIRRANQKTPMARRIEDKFDVVGKKVFGSFAVYEMRLKEIQPEIKKKKVKTPEEQAAPKKPKAERTERVRWGDI